MDEVANNQCKWSYKIIYHSQTNAQIKHFRFKAKQTKRFNKIVFSHFNSGVILNFIILLFLSSIYPDLLFISMHDI